MNEGKVLFFAQTAIEPLEIFPVDKRFVSLLYAVNNFSVGRRNRGHKETISDHCGWLPAMIDVMAPESSAGKGENLRQEDGALGWCPGRDV